MLWTLWLGPFTQTQQQGKITVPAFRIGAADARNHEGLRKMVRVDCRKTGWLGCLNDGRETSKNYAKLRTRMDAGDIEEYEAHEGRVVQTIRAVIRFAEDRTTHDR